MNLIIVVSACAALTVYFDAEKLNIKPWKWLIYAFLSCFISYYIIYSVIGISLVFLNYYSNPLLNIFLTIFTYAAAILTVKPISKRMKIAANNESANKRVNTDC
jgi:RsiW-degrading membrane proteinase PrsW (M82 family)